MDIQTVFTGRSLLRVSLYVLAQNFLRLAEFLNHVMLTEQKHWARQTEHWARQTSDFIWSAEIYICISFPVMVNTCHLRIA